MAKSKQEKSILFFPGSLAELCQITGENYVLVDPKQEPMFIPAITQPHKVIDISYSGTRADFVREALKNNYDGFVRYQLSQVHFKSELDLDNKYCGVPVRKAL